jgi:phosphatidylinositol alpha-mannosyltransferase
MKRCITRHARIAVTKQLKIGFVLDTSLDPPDGVQQYILSLGGWMRSEGHDVHYLVGETMRTDVPNTHSLSKNFTVTFNGNKTTIPLWANHQQVKQLLKQESFDVLHVQSPHHPLMAQYIIRHADSGTAVISTFHILPYNNLAKVSNQLLGMTLRSSLKRLDTALSVSTSAAKFQKETFGMTSDVLPNVFDYDRFANAEPLDQTSNSLNILFLGRLVERKGCQYLLQAISKLDRIKLPRFRVTICGKGALMPELEKFVQKNNLQDIVEFTGFVSEADKPRYYASADISVFPSTSGESFGIVLLEAMASGKSAVLAGNNPGYETVMDSRPETLFDPRDISVLADKLSILLSDVSRRKALADWGKTHSAQYDVKVVGPKLISYYEMAIAKRTTKQHNKD